MTREEAIKYIEKADITVYKEPKTRTAEALEMAIKALEQSWIPVSERLPETNDDVLVYDRVDMFVAWYSWEGMGQGWNSSDNKFDRYTSIIAWMPLPEEPYKAESEEDK